MTNPASEAMPMEELGGFLEYISQFCIDWDGAPIPDAGEPRIVPSCGNIRKLIAAASRPTKPQASKALEPVADDGRRPGRSKLVYNKATRTIDTVRTPDLANSRADVEGLVAKVRDKMRAICLDKKGGPIPFDELARSVLSILPEVGGDVDAFGWQKVPTLATGYMMDAGVAAANREPFDVEGRVGHRQIRAAFEAMLIAAHLQTGERT